LKKKIPMRVLTDIWKKLETENSKALEGELECGRDRDEGVKGYGQIPTWASIAKPDTPEIARRYTDNVIDSNNPLEGNKIRDNTSWAL